MGSKVLAGDMEQGGKVLADDTELGGMVLAGGMELGDKLVGHEHKELDGKERDGRDLQEEVHHGDRDRQLVRLQEVLQLDLVQVVPLPKAALVQKIQNSRNQVKREGLRVLQVEHHVEEVQVDQMEHRREVLPREVQLRGVRHLRVQLLRVLREVQVLRGLVLPDRLGLRDHEIQWGHQSRQVRRSLVHQIQLDQLDRQNLDQQNLDHQIQLVLLDQRGQRGQLDQLNHELHQKIRDQG